MNARILDGACIMHYTHGITVVYIVVGGANHYRGIGAAAINYGNYGNLFNCGYENKYMSYYWLLIKAELQNPNSHGE